jgi:hypothetical protein
VLELGLERGVVATPAVDEEELGSAAAGALVVQSQSGDVRVRHDRAIVAPQGQKIQTTG